MKHPRNIVRAWLQIETPSEQEASHKKEAEDRKKLLNDLEFWHKTFRAFSVIPCAHCKVQMRVYPYGGAYYTDGNGKKIHAECYDDYLENQLTGGNDAN